MKSNKGVAIITALMIMVVVGLLATGGALVTRMELNIARNDASSLQAHYAAQAGLQKYQTVLFQYFRWLEFGLTPGSNPEKTACFDRMAGGLDLDRNGTEEYTWSSGTITFAEEAVENSAGEVVGTYVVSIQRDSSNNHMFTLESRGKSSNARATVRSVVLIENTGVLQNAIFTGDGQANKHINGGVTIRGGVYVVGTEDDPTTSVDESNKTLIDSNGNFSMLNDYDLTGTAFASHVSSGNIKADNLCASLRVDNGRVELSGSVKIGDPDNWLLGTYIGDQAEDLIVNETLLQCKNNKGICSEIGRFTLDLAHGSAPKFPELSDPPADDADCNASTWKGCIFEQADANGMSIMLDSTGQSMFNPSEVSVLDASCRDFIDNQELLFDSQTIDCTFLDPVTGVTQGFRYSWTEGNGFAEFEVYGTVNLTGYNVKFARDVEYTAVTEDPFADDVLNASFAVLENVDGAGGNIDFAGDVLTSNDDLNHLFPNHVLGFVAENDIYQGEDADHVMAPVYAGNRFSIVQDNTLVGSVVANEFCTTDAGGGKCNAGQNTEIIYVNTGYNKPKIMQFVDSAGIPLFKVLSYERR